MGERWSNSSTVHKVFKATYLYETNLFFESDVSHGRWQLTDDLNSADVGNVLNASSVIDHLCLLKTYFL